MKAGGVIYLVATVIAWQPFESQLLLELNYAFYTSTHTSGNLFVTMLNMVTLYLNGPLI